MSQKEADRLHVMKLLFNKDITQKKAQNKKSVFLDKELIEKYLEKFLIAERKINPNCILPFLKEAVHSDRIDKIEKLLEIRKSLKISDKIFETALMLASIKGQENIVLTLLKNGVDINAKKEGFSPLMRAAQYGSEKIVEVLVEKGADINAVNKKNYKASEIACKAGEQKIAQFLKGKENAINDDNVEKVDGKSSGKREREQQDIEDSNKRQKE